MRGAYRLVQVAADPGFRRGGQVQGLERDVPKVLRYRVQHRQLGGLGH
ncbi:hypothetical protein ACH4UM_21710 [Streptomyces sp. NPDC020801]